MHVIRLNILTKESWHETGSPILEQNSCTTNWSPTSLQRNWLEYFEGLCMLHQAARSRNRQRRNLAYIEYFYLPFSCVFFPQLQCCLLLPLSLPLSDCWSAMQIQNCQYVSESFPQLYTWLPTSQHLSQTFLPPYRQECHDSNTTVQPNKFTCNNINTKFQLRGKQNTDDQIKSRMKHHWDILQTRLLDAS